MTKLFLVLLVVFACSCGNQDSASNEQREDSGAAGSTTPAEQTPAAAPEASNKEKAIELIAASDCLTCHKIEEKLVGPSYKDVANKYAADDQTKTMLAEKIIKGGKGVWGELAMTPHPQISMDDAKIMVDYILSLKQP